MLTTLGAPEPFVNSVPVILVLLTATEEGQSPSVFEDIEEFAIRSTFTPEK